MKPKLITSAWITFLLCIAFTINADAASDAYDPTDDLFFAFGSKCKGKGALNSAALNDGSGIKYILESIRDDNSCKSITGALADIDSLNIADILKDKEADNDIEALSMQASELELAIVAESKSSTPDMDYVSKLKSELINTKVSLAKNKNKFTQEHTRKRYQTIGNYHKYINILFSKLKQSDQCLTKNPNLAAQVGAQILGVGSTANPKGPTKPADPAKKLEDISKELIPMRDTLAIPKALSELINQDIDHRIGLGQIDENLANLMSLSSNDSLGELIKNYIGLESARSQTRSAKDLTKTNLSSVANIFSENIKNRMEKLSKDAATDSDAKDSLAWPCFACKL